jgi:hypothetical protein
MPAFLAAALAFDFFFLEGILYQESVGSVKEWLNDE